MKKKNHILGAIYFGYVFATVKNSTETTPTNVGLLRGNSVLRTDTKQLTESKLSSALITPIT